MTISSPLSRVDALGNGSATSFSFSPVIITQASDLRVWLLDNVGNESLLTQGVASNQYTVVVPSYPGTGSITYPGAGGTVLPSGWKLAIKQRAPLLQQFQPENQGPFLASNFGDAYDYATMNSQNVQEQIARSILGAETDPATPLPLPTAAKRANQLLGFDGAGTPIAAQPGSALISSALQSFSAASSILAARIILGVGPTVTPQNFGAKGDAATNDSPAFQSAINFCILHGCSLYVPAVASGYLLNTALDLTQVFQGLLIYGDGCSGYPPAAPTNASTLLVNTGATNVGLDTVGAVGLILRDLNISCVSLGANASRVGIVLGNSTATGGAGFNSTLQNVTISMKATGSSVPLYGVNVNCLSLIKVSTYGDYGIVILNSNALSITLPFGAYGPNIQSDQNCSWGCVLYGTGAQAPLWLSNNNGGTHKQLYIHSDNIGVGYTGTAYAMIIDTSTDLEIHVGIDGFMTAVLQEGTWTDINLTGVIWQGGDPIPGGQPFVASFQGTTLVNCRFAIRPIFAYTSLYHYSSNVTPTLVSMSGCSFLFDSTMSVHVFSFDFLATAPVCMFNCKFDGNIDMVSSTNYNISINGVAAATSTYRLFVNSKIVGVA